MLFRSYRFSTKRTDDATDLVHYEYRAYSASAGRWLNRDPILETGGLNLYAFVGNRPSVTFDVDGRRNPPGHIDIDNETVFWSPPLEGKPCCCKPPGFVVFGPIEDNGSDATGYRMRLPPPVSAGCWRDLAIRWTTCTRAFGASGVVPTCNNSPTCSFVGAPLGTYVIGVHIRYQIGRAHV